MWSDYFEPLNVGDLINGLAIAFFVWIIGRATKWIWQSVVSLWRSRARRKIKNALLIRRCVRNEYHLEIVREVRSQARSVIIMITVTMIPLSILAWVVDKDAMTTIISLLILAAGIPVMVSVEARYSRTIIVVLFLKRDEPRSVKAWRQFKHMVRHNRLWP